VAGISINAYAPGNSTIIVALRQPDVDEDVEGYGRIDAVPITAQDGSQIMCSWSSLVSNLGPISASIPRRLVRLRFFLSGQAKLYSFRFHVSDDPWLAHNGPY